MHQRDDEAHAPSQTKAVEDLAKQAGVNEKCDFFLLWVPERDLFGALTIRLANGEALSPGRTGSLAKRVKSAEA
ncbi:hypothetical protein CQ12_39475 [Bradyrhizobium jicamae]|uniref:Uncharacterized protein n=1 Tax=Bradyrhizobium jicamae TaxID=280332 RepID=A0A0R3M4K3_9BRAD|nr:hypothetical protein [Bradyrhizobium jicamae]KRR12943.1 hypothetical protein CQ12_39475 [Bradyrhizobium jicamae]